MRDNSYSGRYMLQDAFSQEMNPYIIMFTGSMNQLMQIVKSVFIFFSGKIFPFFQLMMVIFGLK